MVFGGGSKERGAESIPLGNKNRKEELPEE